MASQVTQPFVVHSRLSPRGYVTNYCCVFAVTAGGCEFGCIIGITISLLGLLLISGIIAVSSSIGIRQSSHKLTDNPAYIAANSQRYEEMAFNPAQEHSNETGSQTEGQDNEGYYDYPVLVGEDLTSSEPTLSPNISYGTTSSVPVIPQQ